MEVTSTSLRETLQRKKYMGEWGPRSRHVRVTMARFPRMVSTYINRMKANEGLELGTDEKTLGEQTP